MKESLKCLISCKESQIKKGIENPQDNIREKAFPAKMMRISFSNSGLLTKRH